MALTTTEIKNKASTVTPHRREGCFIINPPIAIKNLDLSGTSPSIKKGEIVHADMLDESGDHPNTVHLVEKGLWWNINHFELVGS